MSKILLKTKITNIEEFNNLVHQAVEIMNKIKAFEFKTELQKKLFQKDK